MKKRTPDAVNLTPMIDIVFQMIIFFVFTIDLDREKFDRNIEVPDAERAEVIEEFEPATVYVQVMANGNIKIGSTPMNHATFRNIIRSTVAREGRNVPVLIYGDGRARHRDITRVMDICSEEQLWRINVIGMVQRSEPAQ
ncbi:MAG: biopolymer transporter ExbD [Verrucomicrobia bacterium]|nr:biopolymer transporter ExbD [Verrucomicrobiota bacterium]MCH8510524.1 biopolymer transporter ExbD [Kiritimatiellia bacterium]